MYEVFGFSIFLRNTYLHLAEHQGSAENSLGNAVLFHTNSLFCLNLNRENLKPYLFWDIAYLSLVIRYRRFGIANRSQI
jgi:hypothetical protein